MRNILLPFYDDDVSQRAFGVCTQLVRRTNGHLEGLFALRRPQIMEGDSEMIVEAHYRQLDDECRRVAAEARARFDACTAEHGLTAAAVGESEKATAAWREIDGMEEHVIGSHGRLFDLIVIGRQFGKPWLNWRVIAESALFESGRPVMVTPEKTAATIGENVVIAWNPSTETARTIALSMPLLTHARSVTVLSIENWGVPGPAGEELADYLTRAGVAATARSVALKGRSAGERILDECARTGADLLIKGAYTQSRLRQMIFGGATRHVLTHAQLPVVLAA
jgi:nucleotide-binding universal stress UspA family protein